MPSPNEPACVAGTRAPRGDADPVLGRPAPATIGDLPAGRPMRQCDAYRERPCPAGGDGAQRQGGDLRSLRGWAHSWERKRSPARAVRRQTATAMTATEVLVVAKAQMIRLLRTQPAVADRFIAHILARSIRLEADLTDQLLHSGERRLARMLILLADCDERHPRRCALPSVSQEIIAEMVGTTRSRVNALDGQVQEIGVHRRGGGRAPRDTGTPARRPRWPRKEFAHTRPPFLRPHALQNGLWPAGGSTRAAHGRTAQSGHERSDRDVVTTINEVRGHTVTR